MKRNRTGGGFSKEAIASHGWYERLATILQAGSKGKGVLELIAELTERLSVDSTLILRFPSNSAPQLIYGKYRSKERRAKIEEYMSGHYALDPFYLRIDECNEAGMMSLREMIEESFGSSEYYKVHYRSAGLIDEICFCCDDDAGGYVTLSLSRAAGKDRYSEKEIEAARRISPVVKVLLAAGWRELSSGDQLSPGEAKEDQHRLIENARINFGRSILTNREYEILQLLLRGKSIAFISRALGIAINTTRVHRKNIYAKLNIRSGSEIFTLFLDVVSKTEYVPNRDPFIQYQETNA